MRFPFSRSAPAAPVLFDVQRAGCAIDGQELLAPCDVRITAGECVAVRGPNGAGKTTLLRLLAGRLVPTTGHVLFRGATADERRRDVRTHISAQIGELAVYPDLTLCEQLRVIAMSWRIRADEAEQRASATLTGLGIGALARRFPHELSSGQRQLFRLGCALVRPFDVLILDEPEQRLDPERRALLAGILRGVRRRGYTVVFATHDDRLASAVGARALPVGSP